MNDSSGARPHYVVVGAGIVGVSCALHLQQEGFRVTLVDKGDPGRGCSFGNGGLLQFGGCVPLATPAVLRGAPRMLRDPRGPLRIRWRDLPWLTPYLYSFVRSAKPQRVNLIADSLAKLLASGWAGYFPLVEQCGAQDLLRSCGELYVYESEAAAHGAREYHEMRRTRGVSVEYLGGNEARDIEPALGSTVRSAVWLKDTIGTTNPYKFTLRLFEGFIRAGGTFTCAVVQRFEADRGALKAVHTSNGKLSIDGAVIAAGHESADLLAPLGIRVPLRAERGHHVMLQDPGVPLRTPIVSGDHRFGLIPMDDGIRLVGASELARATAPADFSRVERLLEPARELLPGLQTGTSSRWLGCRPSMPDSMPVLGTAQSLPNLLLAFGHGHLGLTLAGISGRLIADLASGQSPAQSLDAFSWPRSDSTVAGRKQ
jgi:D-amino-acid dehydrogenase